MLSLIIGRPRCISIKAIHISINKNDKQYIDILKDLVKSITICNVTNMNKASKMLHVKSYQTIYELLKFEKFDTAFIYINDKNDMSIVNHLISLKKNIFIENPNAIIGEWNNLKNRINNTDVILDYSFIGSIDRIAIIIKNFIASKKCGKLLMLQSHNMSKTQFKIKHKMLDELLASNINSTICLFGEIPEVVYGIINNIKNKHKNNFASIILEFKNNKTATISFDLISESEIKNFIAIYDNEIITNYSLEVIECDVDKYIKNQVSYEIQNFLQSINKKNKQSKKLDKIIKIENIINAIYVSSKKYIPIYLNI